MARKRDRLEIIHDILHVIRDRAGKVLPTHIIYKSNLSHKMLKEYMDELVQKALIEEKKDRSGRRSYALTEKGFRFLEDYSMIKGFLESYGLD